MNVLFLAFEGEVRFMARLANRFKSNGHNVFVACCDHFNVTHTKGQVFDYCLSQGLEENEFTHLGDVFRKLNSISPDLSSDSIAWDYLRDFESNYCRRFSLLEIAAMDLLMSGDYHHRDIYYRPRDKNILFKYLELQARWLENVFNGRDIDIIFTINFQYFIKAAAYVMAEAKGIPFLMVSSCRIKDLYLVYDNFSFGTPRSIIEEMKRLQATGDSCHEATEYIEWLKGSKRPAYSDFERTMKNIGERMSLSFRLKELWRFITRYPRVAIFIHKHYRGLLRRNYFLPNYFAYLRTMIVSIWRRIAYFRYSALNRKDIPENPFVFFPLHLIPENSVLTLSKTFNEMECLYQIAKALPIHWKVVVKVNPNMLTSEDTHPNRYYLAMNRFPNVQFISPLIPSAEIIEKASAVACISGTALLEGAIFGKPGFRWGRTEFEAVDIIHEFCSEKVREQLQERSNSNVQYYIQACNNLGLNLDFRLLCCPVTALSSEQREEYERQLVDLERAILQYIHTRLSPVSPGA
jgi:hypothetical protein